MINPVLERIETQLDQLSLSEKLWLMERLVHQIRAHSDQWPEVRETDLAAMANDPAIQKELKRIEAEFAGAETDGLDSMP